MSYIEIQKLSYSYNEKTNVLDDINIDIEKGEWIAVLGHNGSGKSTLAKTLVGLLEPKTGDITIDGITLGEETAYEIRKKIGIVFQNPDNQFVGVTVKDDIAFGMENLCVPREEMLEKINFYAKKVNMLDFLDKEPATLSGGQKQRVAIAGILAMQSDIIIFDEATSMLDPYSKEELIQYIKTLHKDGLTIIMITHDINEALLADRILVMNKGKVFAFQETEKIMKDKETFTSSNLELPVALELANSLAQDDKFKEIRDKLWEYALTK
ncbi:MAG: energy-coupling factor transporter ATPase [Candidatus Izemoplasmatales bacterium]|nr:energy-coupling factor transporter ATPase [Candidatus Izemoplasmatales bacterium]